MLYSRRQKIHTVTYLSVAALVLAAFSFISIRQPQPRAEAATSCVPGFTIGVSGSGASETANVTGGVTNVVIGSPTGSASNIQRVIVRANGVPIGRAQPTGTYSWSMPWVTGLHANGPAHVDAEIFYGNATTPCTVNGTSVNIYNATAARLTAAAQPASWKGPMSFSFPIGLRSAVSLPTFDATPYALYTWSTTIGNVNPDHHMAQFSSGQTTGTGAAKAIVRYGGAQAIVSVPITVDSPSAPLPSPDSPTTTTPGTTSTTPTTNQVTTTALRAAAIQNNPVAQGCVVGIVGQQQFAAFNTGAARPTSDAIDKFRVCFASSNYILPSNFAPVAPTTIKDLPKSTKIVISELKNVTMNTDSGKKEGVRLQGKAQPNQVVFVYIFSDPLVLTTTADANGNWEYTLQDPIESGKHEVYTVVDRGDGTYERSQPLSLFIGTASAAEGNPNGLSLRLIEEPTPAQSNRGLVMYAAGSVATVLMVLSVLLLVVRRRRQKAAAVGQADTSNTIPPDSPINPPAPPAST